MKYTKIKKISLFFLFNLLFFYNILLQANDSTTWDDSSIYQTSWVNLPFLRAKKPVDSSYNYNAYDNNTLSGLPEIKIESVCKAGFFKEMGKWEDGLCYLNADFEYNCPGDSFLVGFESRFNGFKCLDPDCKFWDRQYKFKCAFIKNKKSELLKTSKCLDYPTTLNKLSEGVTTNSDPNNSSSTFSQDRLSKLEEDSKLSCPDNYFVKGIQSAYNRSKKDRIFSIKCCKLRTFEKKPVTTSSNCSISNYPSSSSNYNSNCANNLIINQIDLKYEASGKKDRTLKIQCCSGDIKP